MRTERRAEQVKRVLDVGHPVADRLVDGVLERLAAALDRDHFRAEQLHAKDVGLLAGDVDAAHVDVAVETEQRAGGRAGDAMLTRAGLGDDPLLAHPLSQQRLTERVVDLVRAGVRQVLALEVNLRAAERLGQPTGVRHGSRSPGVGLLQVRKLILKLRISHRFGVGGGQFVQRRDQRLRHEAPAELAVVAALVRDVGRVRFDIVS